MGLFLCMSTISGAVHDLRWLAPLLYYYGEPSRILPIWAVSSEAFLVYIAAILFYKPIFTQPLGFIFCAASAVE